MSSDLALIAGKLAPLIRLLSSDQDGEILAAVRALVRTLRRAGADIHALADRVEKSDAGGLTEAEMRKLYDAGYAAGVRAAENEQNRPFFRNVNLNDDPSWHDIARECAAPGARLRDDRERKFVNDMVRWTVHGGAPTEKQAKWLRSIYARIR